MWFVATYFLSNDAAFDVLSKRIVQILFWNVCNKCCTPYNRREDYAVRAIIIVVEKSRGKACENMYVLQIYIVLALILSLSGLATNERHEIISDTLSK